MVMDMVYMFHLHLYYSEIISDKEICNKIVLDIGEKSNQKYLDQLKGSIVESNTCITEEAALKYIVSQVIFTPLNMDKETGIIKKRQFAIEVLNNDLFPHCHTSKQKIISRYMVLKLLKC